MDDYTLWMRLGSSLAGARVDLGGIPGQLLMRAIEGHGVAPLLLEQHAQGLVAGLTPTTTEKIKTLVQHLTAHDMLLNHAAREFFVLASNHQLPCLLMKGAAVANLCYPGSRLRPRTDTDVYIAETSRQQWATLLAKEGYTVLGASAEQRAVKQFHAGRHRLQGETFWFDLHFRLSNRSVFHRCLPFQDCFERRQSVTALSSQAMALDDSDLFLHACIHRIAHGRNAERNRLIWLYDIHLLWKSMGAEGRSATIERALQQQVGYLCADALTICAGLFKTPVGAASLRALESQKQGEPSTELVHAGKAGWLWSDLLGEAGARNKLAFLRELISKRFGST